jgi:hypothetical protein
MRLLTIPELDKLDHDGQFLRAIEEGARIVIAIRVANRYEKL